MLLTTNHNYVTPAQTTRRAAATDDVEAFQAEGKK